MEMTSELFPQTTLRDLVFVLCKRKWGIAAIIALVLFGAFFWLFFIRDDGYTVTAKILVRLGQEQATPATVMGTPPPVLGERSQDVNSEVDILQSSELVGQIVDYLHLDVPAPPPPPPPGLFARTRYEVKAVTRRVKEWIDATLIRVGLRERLTPREKAIYLLTQGLEVHPQRDSNIVVASMTVPFRQNSSVILNTLLDRYLTFRLKLYQDESAHFFQQQADTALADLQRDESALQDFEDKADISELATQQDLLLNDISRVEKNLSDDQRAYLEASAKVERLKHELQSKDPNFGALGEFEKDSFPATVLQQLAELQRDREKLRMTDLDSSDRIRNNRDQFNTLSAMLTANLESDLADKKAGYDNRKQQRDTLEGQLDSLHAKTATLEDLKRRVKVKEGDYLLYRKKLEETSAEAILDRQRIGNVSIVQHATDPVIPSGMRKTTMLGLAFVAAIFAALAWVSVLEFFDHRVYTSEALQQILGAPVLAVVPGNKQHSLKAVANDKRESAHAAGAHAG